MSFLTTLPEELLAAQGTLQGILSNLAAQNAGAAAPTTTIIPAAADPVSAQQAGIFSAYGTMYQQMAAEAQAVQEQYVNTLGVSSGTYSATEAANASQAALPGGGGILDFISFLLGGPVPTSAPGLGGPLGLSGNFANLVNIGAGNWASAQSNLFGFSGLLNSPEADAAAAADLANSTAPVAPVGGVGGMAGMGAMPMTAGVGQATMVGKLSVPPSWAGTVAPATSSAAAVESVGWTAAAPQAGPGTIVPGMPGMGAARNSAGFGAPRYGVKPIVMPKPTAV
jgi:PE family/PPE-SVP subfamily C-terminal region